MTTIVQQANGGNVVAGGVYNQEAEIASKYKRVNVIKNKVPGTFHNGICLAPFSAN
ncbi:hypothetical protein J2Y03_004809 [Neobacillus niacini]|uniref:hypothetical protein n=1 Tax=Neobacillus niacini TaxID=86668 RepID=UPI00285DF73A|nr:hypothetical protein [Neobacillus niacini]MDR7079751.1 hypothetical protein [Neobacillus niacini]